MGGIKCFVRVMLSECFGITNIPISVAKDCLMELSQMHLSQQNVWCLPRKGVLYNYIASHDKTIVINKAAFNFAFSIIGCHFQSSRHEKSRTQTLAIVFLLPVDVFIKRLWKS